MDMVHLKHTQTAENVLYSWLFLIRGPPVLGKIWSWLLPDKGGVSCRYVGPSVRLMNGGFYLETTRELQERMSGRATKRQTLAALLAWADFSKHVLISQW